MRKPLLVAPIGCYFNKLTAVGTTLNCARRHDFLLFRATATATPTSLLQRVPWGTQRCPSYDEKNHFSLSAASLLAEPSRSFEHLKLILSETICLKLSKIIWNYLKMSETILSGSTLSESKWKCLKVMASWHTKCHNGWRTEVVFELLPGLPDIREENLLQVVLWKKVYFAPFLVKIFTKELTLGFCSIIFFFVQWTSLLYKFSKL
jgi:hypothetical protein